MNIIAPLGNEKPPKEITCWLTDADRKMMVEREELLKNKNDKRKRINYVFPLFVIPLRHMCLKPISQPPIHCKRCGKEFYNYVRTTKKYCSNYCAERQHRDRVKSCCRRVWHLPQQDSALYVGRSS